MHRLSFAALALCTLAAACSTAIQDKPFLYEVNGPKGPSYLLGTLHVGVTAETDLPRYAWQRFHSSSTLVMETDPSAVDDSELLAAAKAADGRNLENLLPRAQWTNLTAILHKQYTPDQIRAMSPQFVMNTLLVAFAPGRGYMDLTLAQKAHKAGKRIESLEDTKYQLTVFKKATNDDRKLVRFLGQLDKKQTYLEDLVVSYRMGDSVEIESFIDRHEDESKRAERGKTWMDKIESYIANGGAFIAVGVGHLLGKDNLIDLLRAKGHEITRVTQAESAGATTAANGPT